MEDYLSHHGILGMHWGVRRYQNKDGSLTPRGRQRYSDDLDELEYYRKKQRQKQIAGKAAVVLAVASLSAVAAYKLSTSAPKVDYSGQAKSRSSKLRIC